MRNFYKYPVNELLLPLLLLAAGQSALAADKELLDILLGNGAITQEQYQQLLAKETLEKEDVARLSFGGGSGLSVASADGAYEVEIGGRLHMDIVDHSHDPAMGVDPVSGTQVRRGRVEFDGVFADRWGWAAEIDFAKNRTEVKDFKLGFLGEGASSVHIGHQKQPFSLSLEMSSNDEPFVERSVDNALIYPFADRALGIRGEVSGERWFLSAGLFGESPYAGKAGDEGVGAMGRVVYAPLLANGQVLHLGLRYLHRTLQAGTPELAIRDKTSDFSGLSIVNTGIMPDVSAVSLAGPEFGLALGPLYVFGEYTEARVERDQQPQLEFDAWHLAAAWTLTGESRADSYEIDAGEFKGLRPARHFDPASGGIGLVELAARYAEIDLNDGLFVGGSEEVASLALNWQPNDNVRLMFDWSHIVDTDGSNLVRMHAPDMDILTFRTQYNY